MSGARLSWREWLMLALVSLALFLPGFASLPPTDRDESRYVVTSHRMVDTGDIVDLRFQDQPRYLQPAGIYWAQAASASVFGRDAIWAYRIPSLLGALFAVLMTGWLGVYFFGRRAGIAAALLLAACFSLNFEARIAKIDAVLLASITAAQLALMRAYVEPKVGRWTSAAFWAALGVGLLVKGPLVILVSGTTIAALVIWDRKARWLLNLRPQWGPLLTLAIALPWFIAIGVITDGAFYKRSLMRNFLGKVGTSEQGHKGPFGYHLALFIAAMWPASLLALRAVGFAWRERATPAIRFLLCWLIPSWIVFEFVATKLPHYVLPTYPAIALIAGAALFAPQVESKTRGWVFAFVCLIWLAVSAVIAALGPAILMREQHITDPVSIVLAIAAFAAACAALYLLWRKRFPAVVGAMTLSALLVWTNLFAVVAPQLSVVWLSPRINAEARAVAPCPNGRLITTPYSEPSLVFLYGWNRTVLSPDGGRAADDFAAQAACNVAMIGADDRATFLAGVARHGLAVREAGKLQGRNYSNNDDLDLTFYVAQAAPAPGQGRGSN
ncbi:MAG TPA: glycosyltransferase family 39 protein [Vitreimonas sp.]|nr:glycosyltransferase family 39 protein [Vitreimonas sp.]